MYFDLNKLYTVLKNYNNIIIYGTGVYSNTIYPKLCLMGLRERIKAFVETERPKVDSIDGIPIYNIYEIKHDDNTVILLAVSEKHNNEIASIVEKLGIKNHISLCKYEKKTEEVCADLSDATWEQWKERIIDWYIFSKGKKEEFFNRNLVRNHVDKLETCRAQKNNKQIVFIVGFGSPRIIKIINALCKRGYSIILLTYGSWIHNYEEKAIDKLPVLRKHCETIEELLYQALKFTPQVYYFRPTWGDCSWLTVMLNLKSVYGKIIIDIHDVLKGTYYLDITEKQFEDERKSLENADGIVWRYFAKEYLETKYGYKYNGRSIQFLDCCYGEKRPIKKNNDKKIKICYVSATIGSFLYKYTKTGNLIHPANFEDIFGVLGNDRRVEYHVFVGILSEEEKIKLDMLEQQYTNFKYFHNVDIETLLNTISGYDYSCQLSRGELSEDESLYKEYNQIYESGAYIISATNRYYDYIDAGLPIITNWPKNMCEYLSKYGVFIDMDIETLNIDQLIQEKEKYKENVYMARKELSIDNQIGKLIQFIDDI